MKSLKAGHLPLSSIGYSLPEPFIPRPSRYHDKDSQAEDVAMMDERARIPVTLPRNDPTESYWQDPPDDIADLRTTDELPGRADVVIIGSGMSGAAIAWNLLQDGNPSPSIVMLEARQACSGATGRNGKSLPFNSRPRD